MVTFHFPRLLGVIVFLFVFHAGVNSQNTLPGKSKKIVVAGSSVAAGWVTSRKEKYDMQNGYVARLARVLEQKGWQVENKSVPGYTTADVVANFDSYASLRPDYLLIGLSMSNEGLGKENPDSVIQKFRNGMRNIIRLCTSRGITPVIGLCYSNNSYSPVHYEYIKEMNNEINSWGLPCVNLLGALNDGLGHFPEGYTFDEGHPDNTGHEELFYAFCPDLFDALESGKKMPDFSRFLSFDRKDKDGVSRPVYYVPSWPVHSFLFSISAFVHQSVTVGSVDHTKGKYEIRISGDGKVQLWNNSLCIITGEENLSGNWHQVGLNHNYLNRTIELWVDGCRIGSCVDSVEPVCFAVQGGKQSAGFGNFMIYRSSLNGDEMSRLSRGIVPLASQEFVSMLNNRERTPDWATANMALSTTDATTAPLVRKQRIAVLKGKIGKAALERSEEPVFRPKVPIASNPADWTRFVGKYELSPGDYFLVTLEDSRLFMDDRGNKAELLPESSDKFFIQYPADLTVLFTNDSTGRVSGLIFSMNGREMKATKAE